MQYQHYEILCTTIKGSILFNVELEITTTTDNSYF